MTIARTPIASGTRVRHKLTGETGTVVDHEYSSNALIRVTVKPDLPQWLDQINYYCDAHIGRKVRDLDWIQPGPLNT